MTTVAFIGDIHGCIEGLRDVLSNAGDSADLLVFLGDYVDRGPGSKEVIDLLIQLDSERSCVFLAGNHDRKLLQVLDDDAMLNEFLRMGGATTIRSYVTPPYRDVLSQLRRSFPEAHRAFLSRLRDRWTDGQVIAVHDARDALPSSEYVVAGHAAQATAQPDISDTMALIDTGCGTVKDGRLTCFYWPTKKWVQSRAACL